MKLKKDYFSIIYILFNIISITYAQDVVNYKLITSDIRSVSYIMDSPDSTFLISIKLNNEAANKFKEFTKNNIGKMLKIIKNTHVLIEAIIKGEIPNGNMSISNLKSKNEVIKVFKILIE
jgi:preprotein translocase subunit SecD